MLKTICANHRHALFLVVFSLAGGEAHAGNLLPLPAGCVMGANTTSPRELTKTPAFPPIQLEVRTTFEPTLTKSSSGNYLVYELRLQNYSEQPLMLAGLDIVDAARKDQVVVTIDQQHLGEMVKAIGVEKLNDDQLLPGQGAVVFLCLAFHENQHVPNQLRHQIQLDHGVAEGPAISTRHNPLKTISRPVIGDNWIPANGPSLHSHHRTGLLFTQGVSQIARRFAIDWKILQDDTQFAGDGRDTKSYFAYGKPVLAVADGIVVVAKDGFPDNIPRTAAGFETALPVTMDNLAGNTVILDLGDGQFAHYAHLQPGSVRVKVGDKITGGTVLANIGNSGDSRWPHLHFQISTTPDILASEGLPFLIDHYRAKLPKLPWQDRQNDFPMGEMLIDFGSADTKADIR
ncbi:MAG: M23 family metallopeptidase [Gammaproteobacteria bacterium]|nr:M23 family metallopeptidase [Gammaproteobacteria bacterium]